MTTLAGCPGASLVSSDGVTFACTSCGKYLADHPQPPPPKWNDEAAETAAEVARVAIARVHELEAKYEGAGEPAPPKRATAGDAMPPVHVSNSTIAEYPGREWFDNIQQLVRDATGNGHVERLEWGMDRPDSWLKHLYRYGFAASFVERGDVVLDAACGNGYGRPIIEGHGATWYGADKSPPSGKTFVVDLETWKPPIAYDVFIGLETIEHLHDPTAYLEAAKKARRRVILSTPIVPTKHFNGFHVTDWTKDEIEAEFSGWRMERFERQEGVYGVWAFTKEPQEFVSPQLVEPQRSEMDELRERLAVLEAKEWQPDEIERLMAEHPRLPPWKRGA